MAISPVPADDYPDTHRAPRLAATNREAHAESLSPALPPGPSPGTAVRPGTNAGMMLVSWLKGFCCYAALAALLTSIAGCEAERPVPPRPVAVGIAPIPTRCGVARIWRSRRIAPHATPPRRERRRSPEAAKYRRRSASIMAATSPQISRPALEPGATMSFCARCAMACRRAAMPTFPPSRIHRSR